MSWKSEVQTDNTGKWYGNALRFATKQEAELWARDLMTRWIAVRVDGTRAVESEEPVNYLWDMDRGLLPVNSVNADKGGV